ncbi:uncharacterized protein BDZ99DRAFT_478824 [Mytilinidion resinicola]|uniref:Uncharacterized protein n=1 Tax=Mytilinidion resinicola TaxID=574789 RepID=A0A6A6YES8_9PEZI|nr:uncharacterized protein BDZ99DRAFT_478824 [Mytilinidion resinicola]KAF2807332.1 hypothetical protein BDZ99DRAFT_478824 [Mytilinidion resinicola]
MNVFFPVYQFSGHPRRCWTEYCQRILIKEKTTSFSVSRPGSQISHVQPKRTVWKLELGYKRCSHGLIGCKTGFQVFSPQAVTWGMNEICRSDMQVGTRRRPHSRGCVHIHEAEVLLTGNMQGAANSGSRSTEITVRMLRPFQGALHGPGHHGLAGAMEEAPHFPLFFFHCSRLSASAHGEWKFDSRLESWLNYTHTRTSCLKSEQ